MQILQKSQRVRRRVDLISRHLNFIVNVCFGGERLFVERVINPDRKDACAS
jgi:hypothetical protein